ncbi:hypothetical protein [Demequina muriae]|uniref:MinD-like ATPase involved in chromosome partitioning or flagellar assembly n=1 Tax=Demequina muriae TaxID=3051664 RepID=A0ABT8GFQ4_9MICO|nr:hypothetical protein [Demequina sp. EGI L300058]MDN4480267.1 hypothetical protein [Demequina sp. EGI L300058]
MTPVLGATAVRTLDRAVRDVHAPTPTVRRIVVTSLERATGASTVAALLAHTLVRHRGGRVLLTGASAAAGDVDALPHPTTTDLATLPPGVTGDVRPWHGAWRSLAPVDDRAFDVSVVDGGHLSDPLRAHVHLAGAHVVLLVSSVERVMGEQALVLADALAAHPEGAAATVAFVNRQRSRSPWPQLICRRHPRASTVLPYDEALATEQYARVSQSTRIGMLEIAGDLMVAERARAAR